MKKIFSRKNLLIAGLLIVLFTSGRLAYIYIDTLNDYSNFLLAIITLVLVIITGFYAHQTREMAKMTAYQMKSDLKMSDINLVSCFNRKYENGESALTRIKKGPISILINQDYDFYLSFKIFNKSSCSGSIEKPLLVLSIKNSEFSFLPQVKFYNSKTDSIVDNGATVFLRGGDFQVVDVKYTNDQMGNEWTRKLIEFIKSSNVKSEEIDYFIKYKDNNGCENIRQCVLET